MRLGCFDWISSLARWARDTSTISTPEFLPAAFSGLRPYRQAPSRSTSEWSGETAALKVKDLVNGYAGEYHECSATIQWTAQEAGFMFVSDPASTSATRFAEIGRERNGKFFGGE